MEVGLRFVNSGASANAKCASSGAPTLSQLFFRDSLFGHFRQIRQFRDFYIRLKRILAIFGIFPISFKIATAISRHFRHIRHF